MNIPVQISLHGIAPSEAIHDDVHERVAKLERYYPHITGCRVTVELAGRHKRHGKRFSVHIDLRVPGGELAVTHQHDEDLHVALRDAFRAARRRLEDHAREQRGDVKRRDSAA